MNLKNILFALSVILLLTSCTSEPKEEKHLPRIAFLDYVEDATLAKARQGFMDALSQNGFIKDSTIEWDYLNAQGDQPTLIQACQTLFSKKPELIATNTTLATITASQQNKTIPIFMMVAPRPDIAKLTNESGEAPANLFGVYETLWYIDSSVNIIRQLMPKIKTLGLIYSQSESQSLDALNVVKLACEHYHIELKSLPVTNSSETQLVTQALLSKKIDAFFALPDNVIFSSFETVVESCNKANVPIFTSEAGLVSRGAIASYGADFYQWGFQSGLQASEFLKTKSTSTLKPEEVKFRKKVFNNAQGIKFAIVADSTFVKL